MGDIASTALNTYTDHQYINLAYKIINKTGQYKIGLWEWNCKDTAGKTWDAFKLYIFTSHKGFKDVDNVTVVDADFQSENINEKIVEGIGNFLQPTDDDKEDTVIIMENKTIQYIHMLSQLMQKMKKNAENNGTYLYSVKKHQ